MDSLTIFLSKRYYSNAFIAEEDINDILTNLILAKANHRIPKYFTNAMVFILEIENPLRSTLRTI